MALGAVTLGTDSVISIGATGQGLNGTFVEIAGITSGSISWSHDAVDSTNNDDAGWTSAVIGNGTVTLSFEGRFDPSDTAQGTLRTAGTKTPVKKAFQVYPMGEIEGEDEYVIDGIITSFELNPGANNEPINFSCEVQSSGTHAALVGAVPAP